MTGPLARNRTPLAILRALAALRQSLQLYPDGHVVIDQNLDALEAETRASLDAYGRLRMEIVGGVAHVDGYPFRLESALHQTVLDELIGLGVECLQIDVGVARGELLETAVLLNEVRDRKTRPSTLRAELERRRISNVAMTRLVPVVSRHRCADAWPDAPETVRDASYAATLDDARGAVGGLFEGASPDAAQVGRLLGALGDRIVNRRSALAEILAVKRYENHTYYHSVNVASLSVLFGRRLSLPERVLEDLAEAALLHDVGKRSIPVEIVRKPGPLNRREWKAMQRHPALGAEVLASAPGFRPLTATVALEHHREWAGGGYPDLGESRPHMVSQIVAVCDTYEALTGARSYRAPLVPDEACLLLARFAGEKLNPALVRAFVGLVTFFPLGSVVRLSGGEVGVVVDVSEDEPLHPTVWTIDHARGAGPAGRRIDTTERNAGGGYARHVMETLPEEAPALPDEAWADDGRPRPVKVGPRAGDPGPMRRPRRPGRPSPDRPPSEVGGGEPGAG